MSILEKIFPKAKFESLNNLKVKITKYCTPISYMEYCMKSMFLLSIKKVNILFYLMMITHIVFFLLSYIFPTRISKLSIVLSFLYTVVFYLFFSTWRTKVKRKKLQHTPGKIKKKPLNIKPILPPSNLQIIVAENHINLEKLKSKGEL